MSEPRKEYLCDDCGCKRFSFYSDTLLSCDDCGQIKDLPTNRLVNAVRAWKSMEITNESFFSVINEFFPKVKP